MTIMMKSYILVNHARIHIGDCYMLLILYLNLTVSPPSATWSTLYATVPEFKVSFRDIRVP